MLDQFMEAIKPFTWWRNKYGQIRSADITNLDGSPCCPVAVLLPREQRIELELVRLASQYLDLPTGVVRSLMNAADCSGVPTALRLRLLKHCGLPPPPPPSAKKELLKSASGGYVWV